jgi:hypothetical protein
MMKKSKQSRPCPQSADGMHRPCPDGHSSRTGIVYDRERDVLVITMLCDACSCEGSATFPVGTMVWPEM